ncbi:lysosomal acid phosphatase [Scleropages formosus]|nr:lysosomal acid phosphatase [Scleropages formosus]
MALKVLFLSVQRSPAFTVLQLLTLCVLLVTVVAERTRVFVTVVYRHGDRSPVKSYPNDPYQESAWPQGFGQLSQKGMQQHLKLGQNLRQRYQDLLNMTYNRHEIFVRSTDYDRTLMSAEVNLAGMYPPNGSQVFDPNVHWQPIPVHAVPQDKDQLLLFPMSGCPRYEALMNETRKSEVFKNMSSTYKDFLEMVQNKTGLKDANMESVWSVHDTLFCEQMHNMTLPPWVTPDVMEKLGILKDFSFQVMFGVYKSEEKCRLQGGVLLNQITKNISASAVTKNQQLKMIVYSAHDTTVVALQSALKVFSGKQPTYASCHMFELFREDNGSFSVAMFYWNDSSTEPYPLILPGCVQYCPLEEFIRLTKPVIPVDWKQECQVPSGSKDTEVIVGLAVCGCLLCILIGLLLTILCRQQKSSHGYSHVGNEGDDHS